MIQYGGNAYNRNKKRNTVRIPGGIGDREPVPAIEEIPDPKSIEGDDTVVELNDDVDIRAGLEMAADDQHYPQNKTYTDPGPTLYDQQVQDAHSPASPSFYNGNLDDLATSTDPETRTVSPLTEADQLQDRLEKNDQETKGERDEREESFFKRLKHLFHRREDKYKNKRG